MDSAERNHFFLAPPGWNVQLAEELNRVFPESSTQATGDRWQALATNYPKEDDYSLAFAMQALPNAAVLTSASIRKDADAIVLHLRTNADLLADEWRLHVFVPHEAGFATAGKAKLLRSALMDSFKRKAKSLLPTLRSSSEVATLDEALVQITWLAPDRLAVSILCKADRQRWRRCLSPWSGGVAPIANDPRPPSRAYRKLLEAEAQMGRAIGRGETVVDLGACPGGWSFVALEHGARVTAVDRSPLESNLMGHPRLRFVVGDAFKFSPEAPVDWMIADVAAYPQRTFELVHRWLSNGWCRNVVATVKFVGTDGYAILGEFKGMLDRDADDFRIRKLLENKNEVTIMAWKDSKSTRGNDAATATEA